MRNKKRKFLGQNLSWFVSGALVALLLLSISPVSGAGNLQGFFAKLIQSRIDAVIESNLLGAFEQLEGQEEQRLGGLVEIFQKIFPEGLIVGTYEKGNAKAQQIIVDSSNNLYIGSSTDATFKIDVTTGRITMRNTNFTTSSLNWGGDLSVDSTAGNTPYYTFYADQSAGNLGVGTSTPAYQLEVVNGGADAVLAITATSTNDAVLRLNIGATGATSRWLMYADNSDSDNLKIGTSSDADLMTFAYSGGNVTISKNLTVSQSLTAATTTVESLVTGGTVLSTTTGPAGTFIAQDICSNAVILATPSEASALTLPATTTLYAASGGCLTANGDTKIVNLYNDAAYDGSAITITAPTASTGGIQLVSASSTADTLQAKGVSQLKFQRLSITTTTVEIITSYNAD